jgi:hypothetical protein
MSMMLRSDVDELEVSVTNYWKPDGRPAIVVNGGEVSWENFADLVAYAMCNTDIVEDDPRLKILEDLRSLTLVDLPEGGRALVSVRPVPGRHCARHLKYTIK